MLLRPYTPGDCAAVAALFYRTVHTVCALDYTGAQLDVWAPATPDLSVWNASLLAHDALVAEENGALLGFADMDSAGYLDRLYVGRDCRGRGVARALCDALESRSRVTHFTTHASITARPFFTHRGYRMVKEQQVLRGGVALTNFIMEK